MHKLIFVFLLTCGLLNAVGDEPSTSYERWYRQQLNDVRCDRNNYRGFASKLSKRSMQEEGDCYTVNNDGGHGILHCWKRSDEVNGFIYFCSVM